MIWQNPWAWLGLASVALPVLVHLFGRGHARVHRFPTLRFIEASRLLPTRRTRLNDLALLAVRVAVLVVAVAALTRPLWLTARRTTAANAALARAIIVDTSGTDSASRATQLASDAAASTILLTGDPASTLAGAIAWLETQPMRGEIALVSRFPVGAIASGDVASIPRRLGVRLVRLPPRVAAPLDIRARSGTEETIARVTTSADRTDVEWSASARPRASEAMPVILAGAAERRRADAARAAAATVPVAFPIDSAIAIAVVEPGYEGRTDLMDRGTKPRQAWMMDVVARLVADSTLAAAARRAVVVARPDSAGTLVIARNDAGRAVVLAGEGTIQGREHLVLYSLADAGSLASAALISAAAHATSLAPPLRTLEPTTVSDAELAAWQRAPAVETRPRGPDDDSSDGRWLWIVVLALLALETWMRRERRIAAAQEEIARERAA